MANRVMFGFPEFEDIPLQNSPLREVICQIRFPTILAIAEEPLFRFQDRIRNRFPELIEEHEMQVRFSGEPGSLSSEIDSKRRVFRFTDAENKRQVALASDWIAVTTSDYESWESFGEDVRAVLDSATFLYRIPYAKRVGLRYINEVPIAQDSSDSKHMKGLVRPEYVSLLQTDAWDMPEEFLTQFLLTNGETKLVTRFSSRLENDSHVLRLDFDCYREGTSLSLGNIDSQLTEMHDVIYRAFRWSITEEALSSMHPVIKED
ncbi:MAG: TIGR04255 family protein [Thermomicrobiales bacterium]|nr:TIGR04255 family protein [Thermomicrobiales bacterium]